MSYKHSVTFWRGNVHTLEVFDNPEDALHFARMRHPSQDARISTVTVPDNLPTSADAWPVAALYAVGTVLMAFAWWWFGP
jgi:hypothetical protein